QSSFPRHIVAVLRERERAADLGQIVNFLTKRKRAEEVQTMTEMFLSLQLQRVIDRTSPILNRGKRTVLRVRVPSLHVVGAGHRILVWISHRLQMRAL